MTIEQAKKLKYRETIIHIPSGNHYRVNGMVKTWVKNPNRIKIPIKYGFRGPFGYITEENVEQFDRMTS